MIKFEKCCCCIELRTGGIIIGALGVIGSILQMVMIIVEFSNIAEGTEPSGELKGAVAVAVIACILGLVAGLCLLLGSIKYKNALIKVWLIMDIIFCLFSIIAQLIPIGSSNAVQIIIGVIIQIALTAYFWLCIYSLYVENSGRRT